VDGQERQRPLSSRGKEAARGLVGLFYNRPLDGLISSSYKRAHETLEDLASDKGLDITLKDELVERRMKAPGIMMDWPQLVEAIEKTFKDKDFHLEGGESVHMAQARAIPTIIDLLRTYENKTLALGTHGNIMTIILNHFDDSYGFDFWQSLRMPQVVKAVFQGESLLHVEVLEDLLAFGTYKGDSLLASVEAMMEASGMSKSLDHTKRVADYIEALALDKGYDPTRARTAALLHDIGGAVPSHLRLAYCRSYGLKTCKEEEDYPILLHQKMSKILARDVFGIRDIEVLEAIGCHTTLRRQATWLDKLLFIADKVEWDREGQADYRETLEEILKESLDQAVLYYLAYNIDNKLLKCLHPDYQAAYEMMKRKDDLK